MALLLRTTDLFHASSSTGIAPTQPMDEDEPATTVISDVLNDLGRFRAFSDGRVRVVFADRTILQLSPSEVADECSFTYRDSSTGKCTTDSASPTQHNYITMASDFAHWAFATPEQRFRRFQAKQAEQLLVTKELHKIEIRKELNAAETSNGSIDSNKLTETLPSLTVPSSGDEALSREAISQLQHHTEWHIAHVHTLLQAEDIQRD